jgi:kynurenine formamidase
VNDALQLPLLRCRVITVAPVVLSSVPDEVVGNSAPTDTVVSARALAAALGAGDMDAVAIRTGHGDVDAFSGHNPTYLTATAARLLRERGVHHVLVELPSLDREDDGGFLGAHRAFFGLTPTQKTWSGEAQHHTVTELCRFVSDVKDGDYALSLQLAPLHSDAVPSRPLLFAFDAALETPTVELS